MSSHTLPEPAPLLDAAALDRFLTEVRSARQTLVFTNGCFDLIHPGHVLYLAEARRLGDRLIVGLNSDASVRRLKGRGRPLVSGEGRAAILAALRSVDAVVFFDQDTPRELILKIRPDILVKGGDYSADQVVGAEDLPAWGGRLQVLPFHPGFSTSDLVQNIRNL